MKVWPLVTWGCLCLPGCPAGAHDPMLTAVFPMDFNDTSLQGQQQGIRGDEQSRLIALDRQLRDAIALAGCCTLTPAAQAAQYCNGCELDLARELGAAIVVTGWVQKVSNLILNINIVAREVPSGKIISAGSVDIRGNTDESWSRGLSYLVRNRLHPSQW